MYRYVCIYLGQKYRHFSNIHIYTQLVVLILVYITLPVGRYRYTQMYIVNEERLSSFKFKQNVKILIKP